jgi:putative ATPase
MISLSAVLSGVKEMRAAIEDAEKQSRLGRVPVLFIDEIHRYNRAQQDGLLKAVEDGTVTLIGATTENPSFTLNAALLSRCHVFVLERLAECALRKIVERAVSKLDRDLPLTEAALNRLVELADGDGRFLLNLVEQLADLPAGQTLDVDDLATLLQKRMAVYDRQQEAHFNLISALHKSVRGSDPDAALYWLCRMLEGGEDPRYLARRLVRMALEDIGLAEPEALRHTLAAADAYERLGTPEGELALAQATIYLALANKSNAAYSAFKKASAAARTSGSMMPPKHILNAPTRLMRDLNYGSGYIYDHDTEAGVSGQNYFPDEMERQNFYEPRGRGVEREFKDRLQRIMSIRSRARSQKSEE